MQGMLGAVDKRKTNDMISAFEELVHNTVQQMLRKRWCFVEEVLLSHYSTKTFQMFDHL